MKQKIILDEWQKKVLETEGNICLRSGRQVGKSLIISMKAAEYAVKNPKQTILVIASVERQAFLLFDKILAYLMDNYKSYIKKGKHKPTKHKIELNNGSIIYSLPTGMSGYGIRGFTVNLLIADEAAFIPEDVWPAVTPMLAATKGKLILLSTPQGKYTPDGKERYYYSCYNNPDFKSFHISSEDCSRIDQDFLKREKERMTKLQYAQEYLGEFIDELQQFFPTDIIKKCMTLSKEKRELSQDRYLGVDIARLGEDETVLISLERIKKKKLKMFNMEITRKTMLTETIRLIKFSDEKYNYKKIYIDDGGMGVGVFDPLLEDQQTRRKVVAINNARRSVDFHNDQKKHILKEDLYNNLLRLMEQGAIELWNDDKVFFSLKSIQYEYTDNQTLKIYGKYSHITEALIRAAWCMKDKSLNIYVY